MRRIAIPFYNCNCFFAHNIYIREYGAHFNFTCYNTFMEEYASTLSAIGVDTEAKKNSLIEKIKEEINRRKSLEETALERQELIEKFYKPLKSSVYCLKESFLESEFIDIVQACKSGNVKKVWELTSTISKEKQLFSFPVFTQEFCDFLLEELKHYQNTSLPKGRPNSMNRYGVLLDEIGFHDSFSKIFREEYLDPLSKIIFREWRGDGLDSHKIFTVAYMIDKDEDLGNHYDNSEVTLNVCLGKSFKDGDLYFGDMRNTPTRESSYVTVPHRLGYGILHRGQHIHGALPITEGERHNLIIWLRASSVRNKLCPMCDRKPKELVKSHGYGDGFTVKPMEVCNLG